AESAPVQLLPDFSMLVIMGLILIMIWILNRTFFRPINRIIDARVKNKGGRYTEAERILQDVSEKRANYKAALLEARNEGYDLIEKERLAALEAREAELGTVREEVSQKVLSEKSQIAKQTDAARREIAEQAELMADKITANILNTAR
ncbi:MAG TPA: ATP synthase F0 subunit B, partial [Pyrinomonadaceae bacterium]|nr:ATP synthase F0 subunit B [Pyrinomonadaceae bacterium]